MAEHYSYWAIQNLREPQTRCTPFKPCTSCFWWWRDNEYPRGGCHHPDQNTPVDTCYTPKIQPKKEATA